MINKVQHIGIAVYSLEKARRLYEQILGMDVTDVLEIPERGVKVAMVDGNNVTLELLEPMGDDSSLSNFLEKRGEGIHHIAFRVNNLDEVVTTLKSRGVQFITTNPVAGAHGSRVIFVSPKSGNGVLLELCEESKR